MDLLFSGRTKLALISSIKVDSVYIPNPDPPTFYISIAFAPEILNNMRIDHSITYQPKLTVMLLGDKCLRRPTVYIGSTSFRCVAANWQKSNTILIWHKLARYTQAQYSKATLAIYKLFIWSTRARVAAILSFQI